MHQKHPNTTRILTAFHPNHKMYLWLCRMPPCTSCSLPLEAHPRSCPTEGNPERWRRWRPWKCTVNSGRNIFCRYPIEFTISATSANKEKNSYKTTKHALEMFWVAAQNNLKVIFGSTKGLDPKPRLTNQPPVQCFQNTPLHSNSFLNALDTLDISW